MQHQTVFVLTTEQIESLFPAYTVYHNALFQYLVWSRDA
jgi:hypothetical protein